MKRIIFALSITMFALTGTANAKTTSVEAQFKQSLKATSAALDLGAAQMTNAKLVKTKIGRTDLRKFSPSKFSTVLQNVKRAYTQRTTLLSGYKVVGYARITRGGFWTVTLEKDGRRSFLQMSSSPKGTQLDFRTKTRPAPVRRSR